MKTERNLAFDKVFDEDIKFRRKKVYEKAERCLDCFSAPFSCSSTPELCNLHRSMLELIAEEEREWYELTGHSN